MAHAPHAKVLPADLSAPPMVDAWRARALMVAVLFTVTAIVLAVLDKSWDHFFRAWLVGFMLTFGFSCGGMTVLMLQYVTGGKWGLLLRRPLEAMSRTLPLVFATLTHGYGPEICSTYPPGAAGNRHWQCACASTPASSYRRGTG